MTSVECSYEQFDASFYSLQWYIMKTKMNPPIDIERTMNIQIPALEWVRSDGRYCRNIHGIHQYIRAVEESTEALIRELEMENVSGEEMHWTPLLRLTIEDPRMRKLRDFFKGIYFMNGQDPYRCLILTLLSQNKTAERARWTFNALVENFVDITPHVVSTADVRKLARLLYRCGPHRKAHYIVDASLELLKRWDGDMSWIYDDEDAARATLLSLPGVGPKTADCILLFAAGHDVVPIDTHVERVARRLGFIEEHAAKTGDGDRSEKTGGSDRAKLLAKEALESTLKSPGKSHLLLIQHGFEFCHAKRPDCFVCPVREECNSTDNRYKVITK
jgi:endonuclease-3